MNESQTSSVPVADPRHATLQGQLLRSGSNSGLGALELHGSSGRIDLHAAELLARTGATVLAQRWFGEPGLPEQIQDVPLESFVAGVDMLVSPGCTRIAVLGRSPDAEAAVLPGETTPRSDRHAHGGTDAAEAALGATAWSAIEHCMREVTTAQHRP